jgi:hypothetical protein
MKHLNLIITFCLFATITFAQTIDHSLIKKYKYSHDLDLPEWGPYSKKYNGISHTTSKEHGYRFDLSFAVGFFHRSKMVIPDVIEERDYFIWDVSPDLKYLGYNYQLEWKDKVKCDVVFSEIDEKSRFITTRFTNNTGSVQDVVYNLLASMNYPNWGKMGKKKIILPAHVQLPQGAQWTDGMDYTTMDYATPRYDDNLVFDAFAKGEEYGSGMVNSRGLGRNFGQEKGDRVRYQLNAKPQKGQQLILRYKTNGNKPVVFQAEGILNQQIELKASEDFTTTRIDLDESKLSHLQLTAAQNQQGLVFDGFTIVNKDERVAFKNETLQVIPQIMEGPVAKSRILKYKNTDLYYGILWEGPEYYQVEIHSDNLKELPKYNNRNIDVPVQKENDRGHFTDILVYGIQLQPFSETELQGMVAVGTKEEVETALKKFAGQKNNYAQKRNGFYNKLKSDVGNDPYSFAMQRMHSVMANNLVFPIICENEYIKHYTPGRRWNSLYTWDVGMIGIGMMEMDLNRSVNILNQYTTSEKSDNAFIHHGTPAPTHIYQFLELWNKTNDKTFLRHYYPRIKKYYQFLSGKYGSSNTRFKSGLTKTWDYFYNSAGWDDYPPQRWAEHHDKENLLSPAVSPSHVIRTAKIMKMAARELGITKDIKAYEEDIKLTTKALNKYSWDEESGYFSYVFHDKAGNALDILRMDNGKNMNMGMDGAAPLYAGACNDHQRKLLVDKLLDKTRLWTKLGITVDQKAPHANTNAYSNETVWISHQWFFWKALLDLGYGQEAFELANTALKVFSDETNRTYHCWEHYTQNSLLGTGWHQFSGLNAPLVNWYHIYFKPGNIYGGFNFWIKQQSMNNDYSEANIEFELDELHRSKSKTVLVSMNKGFDYKVKLNDDVIPHKRITERTLMINIPATKRNNRLTVTKAEKRSNSLFNW